MNKHVLCRLLLVVASAAGGSVTLANTSISPSALYTIRDFPEDGTADTLFPSSDGNWIGQVTGPGSGDAQEQTFLEFDLRSLSMQSKATLHLTLVHGGTDKLVLLSTYSGDGVGSLEDWGTGNYLTTIPRPFLSLSGSQISASVDVTGVFNSYIQSGHDFLGIRLHDVVYVPGSDGDQAQVALGNGGTVFPQTIELEPIPEPSAWWPGVCTRGASSSRRK